MIRFDDTVKKVSKNLNIKKDIVKKVLNKTFKEIEEGLGNNKNFMFKGYTKIVKSNQKRKPINKTELFNLKTKEK